MENKQAKGATLYANIRWELDGKICSKTFFLSTWITESAKSIPELYTHDNKSKYSNNPKGISKFAKKKKKKEKLYIKETTSKAATTKFIGKIPNTKKMSNDQFNLCEVKISLGEIIKSINHQANNKSSRNDALTAEF